MDHRCDATPNGSVTGLVAECPECGRRWFRSIDRGRPVTRIIPMPAFLVRRGVA